MNDEEWVKAAMSDDIMVVQLLFQLQQPRFKRTAATLPLDWTVRQPRSTNKPAQRASPTTPLSWSSGFEQSIKPLTRSKVSGDNEKTKTPVKRSRKKKTLTQLKEEENMLVKERGELNREITALRMKLEKQKETNESLKRMKIELKLDQASSLSKETVFGQIMPNMAGDNIASLNMDAKSHTKFALPDLNMLFEDSIHDDVCGVS